MSMFFEGRRTAGTATAS